MRKEKIKTVQDLRGIAILYIVLFHTGNIFGYKIFSHGATGLALFFMISGFIITMVHRNEKGLGATVTFMKKRVARIYPPFIMPFIIVLFLFLFTGKGSDYHRDILNITLNVLLIHNPAQSIHPYSWALVYEMYYYATFCLFVVFFRFNIVVYAALLATPYFLSLYFFESLAMTGNEFVLISPHNLFFCVGTLLGVTLDKIKVTFVPTANFFALALFLATPFFNLNGALLVTTSLLFVVYIKSNSSISWLSSVGNASYSTYLIHAIVLMVLKTLVVNRSLLVFVFFFVSCLICGFLYYFYVEKRAVKATSDLLRA